MHSAFKKGTKTMAQQYEEQINEQVGILNSLLQQAVQHDADFKTSKLPGELQPSKDKSKYGSLAAGGSFEKKLQKLFQVETLSHDDPQIQKVASQPKKVKALASAMLAGIQKSLEASGLSPRGYQWMMTEIEANVPQHGIAMYFDSLLEQNQNALLRNPTYVYEQLFERIQPAEYFIEWNSLNPEAEKSDIRLAKAILSAPSAPDSVKKAKGKIDLMTAGNIKKAAEQAVFDTIDSSYNNANRVETKTAAELRMRANIAYAMKKQDKSLDFYKLISDPVYAVEALEKITAKKPSFAQTPQSNMDLDAKLKELQSKPKQKTSPRIDLNEHVELPEDTRTPTIGENVPELDPDTRTPTIGDDFPEIEPDTRTPKLNSEEADASEEDTQEELHASPPSDDTDAVNVADTDDLDIDLNDFDHKPSNIEKIIMKAYPDMLEGVRTSLINKMKQEPEMSDEVYTYLEDNADTFEKRILTMFNNVRRDKPTAIEIAKVAQEKMGDILVAAYPDEDPVELNAVIFKSIRTRTGVENTIELAFGSDNLTAKDILQEVIHRNVDKLAFKKTDPNNLPIEDARWLSLVNRVGLVESSPYKEQLEQWSAHLPKEEIQEPEVIVNEMDDNDVVTVEPQQPAEPPMSLPVHVPTSPAVEPEAAIEQKKSKSFFGRLLGTASVIGLLVGAATLIYSNNNPTTANDAPTATPQTSMTQASNTDSSPVMVDIISAAPTEAETVSYTIQPGDTLYKIATAADMSVDDLKALNNLDSDTIYAYDTLNVPAGTNTLPSSSSDVSYDGPLMSYTVKSGDTLSSLALDFNTSVPVVAGLNGISNPNDIKAGTAYQFPDNGANNYTSAGSSTVNDSDIDTNNSITDDVDSSAARTTSPTPMMQKNPALRAQAARERIRNGQTLAAVFKSLNGSTLVQAFKRDTQELGNEAKRFGSWLASQERPNSKRHGPHNHR